MPRYRNARYKESSLRTPRARRYIHSKYLYMERADVVHIQPYITRCSDSHRMVSLRRIIRHCFFRILLESQSAEQTGDIAQ